MVYRESYLDILQVVGRVDGNLKNRVGVKVQHVWLFESELGCVCDEVG
jgi:hypothetical protein